MNTGQLLRRLASYVVHGGSWRIRDYETLILRAVGKSLSTSDSAALDAQLASLDHVKRLHSDRMVTFYFLDAQRLPKLSISDPEYCVAEYRMTAPGSTSLRASVFLHLGLLSSIEFSKAPAALVGASSIALKPVRRRSQASIAGQLDNEEHEGD